MQRMVMALMILSGCLGAADRSRSGDASSTPDPKPSPSMEAADFSSATRDMMGNGLPDLSDNAIDPNAPQVPILIAQGLMGRTTISCDDGQSWIADRSFDREEVDGLGNVTKASDMVCGDTQQVRCQQTSCKKKSNDGTCSTAAVCDCLHHPGYGKGVAIGKNHIWANFGWGAPGVMIHSPNGAHWDNPYYFDGGYLYPNVAFGDGRFVHFSSQPHLSDDGVIWRNGGSAGFNGSGQGWTSPRAFNFLKYGSGGRFIGVMDTNFMRISSDGGESWTPASNIPAGCSDGIGNSQRVITGNEVALMVTADGRACRSADGGLNWTLHDISPTRTSDVLTRYGVFAKGQFLAWERLSPFRYRSVDGQTWTREALTGNSWPGGPIGVSPSGTLVGVNSVDIAYESQQFYRSTDLGLTWTALAPNKFEKSHAIAHIQAGMIQAGGICP